MNIFLVNLIAGSRDAIRGVQICAYIDPSVMTYLIQAAAGVAIAAGAGITFHFRKAKKKFNEKMGIDENKNKEVESDDIQIKE